MKSLTLIFSFWMFATALGCASGPRSSRATTAVDGLPREELTPEDQDRFKDLLAAVPVEENGDNDVLSLFVTSLDQRVEPPHEVKEKFEGLVRKFRHQFAEQVTKLREEFRREDRRARGELAPDQKRADLERSLSDRRQLVERDISSLKVKFDDTIQRHMGEFSSRFAVYSKNYYAQKQAVQREKAEEVKTMNDIPATPIGSGN